MENEAIPNAKITASSQLTHDQSFKGRLNAFGWCPTTGDGGPYLQIDLGMPLLVVAIATQGHSYPGSVNRASEYKLKFSKDGSSTFTDVKMRDSNNQVFIVKSPILSSLISDLNLSRNMALMYDFLDLQSNRVYSRLFNNVANT